MKKKLKDNLFLFITFFLSLIMIGVIFYLKKVTPFGENSLLTIDFFHQYGPMMGELYDRVKGGLSLSYSFNMGIGLPFFLNFYNYLSSPFNLLLFFFERKDLLSVYTLIIGLKVSVSSLTMGLFLKYRYKTSYINIPLSLLYAFNAYFIAYYWNIMWLDGLIFLPLITLGIEKIMHENKGLFYTLSLAIMLLANYYIGYMICIFSVIYFAFLLVSNNKSLSKQEIWTKVKIFFVYSLFAGGICAFFLIPLFTSLSGISATKDAFPTSQYYDFPLKQFIYNHFSGVGSTVLKSESMNNAPNISCGVLSLFLLFVLLANSKIKFKTKLCYGVMLLIFVISFLGYRLDYFWHGFHVPNDLPYRYSFLYCFILILVAAHSLKKIKTINSFYVIIIYLILMIMVSFISKIGIDNISQNAIYLNYICLTIYLGCYFIYRYLEKVSWLGIVIITLTIMAESGLTMNQNWTIDQKKRYFYDDYDKIVSLNNQIKEKDQDVYRIEKKELITYSDPSWYGYHGIMGFSSMEYEQLAKMQNRLGIQGNVINSFNYKDNTPIYDMMFNLKYKIDNSYYRKNEDYNLESNKYFLGLMYGVSSNIKLWNLDFDPLHNQNKYLENASGIANVLERKFFDEEIVNSRGLKECTISEKGQYYLYVNSFQMSFIKIGNNTYSFKENISYRYNDILQNSIYHDYKNKYVISFVVQEEPIKIYYDAPYDESINSIFLYKINMAKMDEAYSRLLSNVVHINYFSEDKIMGEVNLEEDMTIYTSIPYDNGWKVYVDDKKIDTFRIGEALLGFDVDKGNHQIRLEYHIPFRISGTIISILSIILLSLVTKYKLLINKKEDCE